MSDKKMVIDLPGKFDTYLSGTSEIQGDEGETALFLAYKNHGRAISRGKGYSIRIELDLADVMNVREVLVSLRQVAEDCVYYNQDVTYDDDSVKEIKAAKVVIERVKDLLATLPAPSFDPNEVAAMLKQIAPVRTPQEPVAAPIAQIRHKSASEIIDGFTAAQKARLLLWFKDVTDDMVADHPGIRFETEVIAMREVVRRDWDRAL